MKWLAAIALLLAIAAGAQEEPHPVLQRFGQRVLFYLSFDDAGWLADLSVGAGEPLSTEGEAHFVPGLVGQAMVGGGALFPAAGNIDLRAEGALAIWVQPQDWQTTDNEPYLWPVRIFLDNGLLMIGRQGRQVPGRQASLYAYVEAGGEKASVHLGGGGTDQWNQGRWHLLVLNWRLNRLELSIDGGLPASCAAPALGNAVRFLVGVPKAPVAHRLAIDDLLVFDRPLSAAEIAWIWQTMGR